MEQPGRVVFDTDDLRLAMTGKIWCYETELMVQSVKWMALRALLNCNQDVIACGTNTTENSLRKLFALDRQAKPLIVRTSVMECERRAIETGHPRLANDGIIKRHFRNLQQLTNTEHMLWETTYDRVEAAVESVRASL